MSFTLAGTDPLDALYILPKFSRDGLVKRRLDLLPAPGPYGSLSGIFSQNSELEGRTHPKPASQYVYQSVQVGAEFREVGAETGSDSDPHVVLARGPREVEDDLRGHMTLKLGKVRLVTEPGMGGGSANTAESVCGSSGVVIL